MADALNPVVLTTFRHELEAGVLVNHLRARGVEARSTGSMVSGGRVEIPADVEVLVPSGQLESARAMLSELDSNDGEVDWDLVDVGDPVEDQVQDSAQVPTHPYNFARMVFHVLTIVGWMGLVYVIVLGMSKAFG